MLFFQGFAKTLFYVIRQINNTETSRLKRLTFQMSKSRSPHFEIAHTDLCLLTLKKKKNSNLTGSG